MFSATVPDGRLSVAGNATTGPAELRLTLDGAGDPARVEVVTVIDGTGVHVSVALSHFGEPMPRLPPPAEPRSVVGPWSGTITDDGSEHTIGEVTDGTVAVAFITTLGIEDITTLVSGLVPFDPANPPTPNPALG